MTITLFIILALTFIGAVVAIGYFNIKSLKSYIENEQKIILLELKKVQEKETRSLITPIQLQAYERLILFLERIDPNALVLRCYQPGMNSVLFKDVMIQNIRNEFEYNQSQQLYISNEAWVNIKNAKEEIISLINTIHSSAQEEITPTAFAGRLLEQLAGKKMPSELASEFLKKEIQTKFN